MYILPGILIIGALVIALALFSITMLGWCKFINHATTLPTTGISYDDKLSACMSLESHSITFMYKEADHAAQGIMNQTECVICLTVFQEDESVRKLHTCKHMFHTSCIDKWLGSRSGCPLCRSQIDRVTSPNVTLANEQIIVDMGDSII